MCVKLRRRGDTGKRRVDEGICRMISPPTVDAMGIARLPDSQQPDNTHGIYRTMSPSLREPAFLLLKLTRMGCLLLLRRKFAICNLLFVMIVRRQPNDRYHVTNSLPQKIQKMAPIARYGPNGILLDQSLRPIRIVPTP